jgi:hypothetical protein
MTTTSTPRLPDSPSTAAFQEISLADLEQVEGGLLEVLIAVAVVVGFFYAGYRSGQADHCG